MSPIKHENGASPDKHMPETMPAGALIFDYNNDGWPDLFFVNGGSFADRRVAAERAASPVPEHRERKIHGCD